MPWIVTYTIASGLCCIHTPVLDIILFFEQSQKAFRQSIYQLASPKCKVSDRLAWNCENRSDSKPISDSGVMNDKESTNPRPFILDKWQYTGNRWCSLEHHWESPLKKLTFLCFNKTENYSVSNRQPRFKYSGLIWKIFPSGIHANHLLFL